MIYKVYAGTTWCTVKRVTFLSLQKDGMLKDVQKLNNLHTTIGVMKGK